MSEQASKTIRTLSFRFTESLTGAGPAPPVTYEEARFDYLIEGTADEWLGRGRHRIHRRASSLLFLPAGVAYEVCQGTRTRRLVIELDADHVRCPIETPTLSGRDHTNGYVTELAACAHRVYVEYLRPQADVGLVLEGWARIMVGLLVRQSVVPPTWVTRLRRLFAIDETTALCDLEALAERAGVTHPSVLSASFERWFGMPPGRYQAFQRVRYACRLLAEGVPQAEVASALYFDDQAHFSRMFCEFVGLTPGDYVRLRQGRPMRIAHIKPYR